MTAVGLTPSSSERFAVVVGVISVLGLISSGAAAD
jgi:hypothetical protein